MRIIQVLRFGAIHIRDFTVICYVGYYSAANFDLLLLQPSNMAAKCGIRWSWKPKVKPNLGFHSNIAVTISYITDFVSSNSSWPNATYMHRDFQSLSPQRPVYASLISVLISQVPHIWGVTNGSLRPSAPNSCRSPTSLISPVPHIYGTSRTPILTCIVWKISNVVTKLLVVLPNYHLQ